MNDNNILPHITWDDYWTEHKKHASQSRVVAHQITCAKLGIYIDDLNAISESLEHIQDNEMYKKQFEAIITEAKRNQKVMGRTTYETQLGEKHTQKEIEIQQDEEKYDEAEHEFRFRVRENPEGMSPETFLTVNAVNKMKIAFKEGIVDKNIQMKYVNVVELLRSVTDIKNTKNKNFQDAEKFFAQHDGFSVIQDYVRTLNVNASKLNTVFKNNELSQPVHWAVNFMLDALVKKTESRKLTSAEVNMTHKMLDFLAEVITSDHPHFRELGRITVMLAMQHPELREKSNEIIARMGKERTRPLEELFSAIENKALMNMMINTLREKNFSVPAQVDLHKVIAQLNQATAGKKFTYFQFLKIVKDIPGLNNLRKPFYVAVPPKQGIGKLVKKRPRSPRQAASESAAKRLKKG